MKYLIKNIDLPQFLFSLTFVVLILIGSFFVIKPFLFDLFWSGMIVIITWPIMIKIQKFFFNNRLLSIIFMLLLLILSLFIPVMLLINSFIDNSDVLINRLTIHQFQFLQLSWLHDIPFFGDELYLNYQKLLSGGMKGIINKIEPYMGKTTKFFVLQIKKISLFLLHICFMLFFCLCFYLKGEKIVKNIKKISIRISPKYGDKIILLSCQVIRSIALGVIVTSLLQTILSGLGLFFSKIPYILLLMSLIFFLCLIQIGPLPILLPLCICLFFNNNSKYGIFLLLWSCLIFFVESLIRSALIKCKIDLPITLILLGVIGGLFSFGMIGLFIGPLLLLISYELLLICINNKFKKK
ncbi:AI-2E family transporter YdiK [Buchnera aphidicola (Taiwanaphis decaspermi)]|uniref:AI-2E family transporter YdiK n=1 Tax=Buchnera aphidicola TaxID=9 RepID=UPI0031B809AE